MNFFLVLIQLCYKKVDALLKEMTVHLTRNRIGLQEINAHKWLDLLVLKPNVNESPTYKLSFVP